MGAGRPQGIGLDDVEPAARVEQEAATVSDAMLEARVREERPEPRIAAQAREATQRIESAPR